MLWYVIRRVGVMLGTLVIVSITTFTIIQLPPGDFATTYLATLEASGDTADAGLADAIRARYGLDDPFVVQYFRWVTGMMHGDFGQSFLYRMPVSELIWERLALTVMISLLSLALTWIIALPLGIYSAIRQYSVVDYGASFIGFLGMSTPPFMLALVMLFLANQWFGTSIGGLFSEPFIGAPWSWAKFVDLLTHLWVPVMVLAVSGTGSLVRTLRANLLDQLDMPYVEAARAKGLTEWQLLLKYPVRLAINPLVSTIGWMLPALVSGSFIVAVVLSLPTTGPLMLGALLAQDMYLAGAFVMMLAVLTMLGTLVSDLLLAWVDPRIRFERKSR